MPAATLLLTTKTPCSAQPSGRDRTAARVRAPEGGADTSRHPDLSACGLRQDYPRERMACRVRLPDGLVERAEGWIAALQIAGLSIQDRSDAEAYIAAFHGDDRYLMDYLMDEVFNRQPPEV